MKKFTAILLTVIMVASLFISCNNSIEPTVTDETVSVSFSEATSRDLAASLEPFNKNTLYWKYAAKKNTADGTGLNSGATANYGQEGEERVWINGGSDATAPTAAGLGSVAGFSQGIWDFKLFAYKLVDSNYQLAYQGEVTGVSLKKGSSNTVNVSVSPVAVAGKKGTLVLTDNITLAPANPNNRPTGLTKVYTVTALGSTVAISPDNQTTNKWTLDAGTYKINVDFVKDGFTYASGSAVATVYSNIQTNVSGDIPELVTKAEFDSSINPDIMNKVASTAANVNYTYGKLTPSESSAAAIDKVTLSDGTGKINAEVPGKAAAKIIDTATGSSSKTEDKVELRLKVDTTAATSSSLSLEISMEATVTYSVTNGSGLEQKITQIKNLTDANNAPVISTVTIQLQTGLKDVKVYHSGILMGDYKSSSDKQGYSYNAGTGVLTIKTSSFSPFEVTYKVPEYPVKIGDVKYASLKAAVDAVGSEATTIEVIGNMSVTETVEISGKPDITINLNNTDITGIDKRVLWVKDGKVTINGIGTISATDGIDARSSVIRVSDEEAKSKNAEVIIDSNVTVTSNSSYGITVFGKNAGTLTVNGTVKTVNAPAISGNGSADLALTDITINGTVISTNNNAIYHPQAGELSVYGTVIGYGGIEAKSGTTVSLGENARVEATAESTSHKENSDGCSTSGYAIVAVENSAYKGNPKFDISGGTYIGQIAIIVDNDVLDSKKASINITGGTFSKNPRLYVSIGYKVGEMNDNFVVSECETHRFDFDNNVNTCKDCGKTYPILKQTTNTDGTYTTGLTSLPNTITNGSYKLFEDISIGRKCIGSVTHGNMNVVIDLGGHTLTSKGLSNFGGFYFHPSSSKNVITFKNGTILESADNTSSLLISIKGANKMIFGPNLNIVCVKPTTTAILLEGAGQLESSANITTKNGAAIQTNGSTTTADAPITINGGNITSDTVAIYLPSGTLKISGGTITGTTAVYTKGHKVTISGGTLVGKGEAAGYVYNGSGCNSTGNAFVVDSCNYPSGVPVVTISGGSFISEKNGAVGSYSGNGVETPVTGFITGGTFSSDPSAYVDTANYNVTDNGSTWTVTAK